MVLRLETKYGKLYSHYHFFKKLKYDVENDKVTRVFAVFVSHVSTFKL